MGATPKQVEVTRAEADAAERELDARVEADVKNQLESERSKQRMDADHKADLESATKQIKDLNARLESEAKERVAHVKRLEELEACAKASRAESDAKKLLDDATLMQDAREVAQARGVAADRLESEVKRIAALGRAAVNELLEATPAPTADPLVLRRLETSAGKKAPIERLVTRGEGEAEVRGYVVSDWAAFAKKEVLA